MDNVPYGCCNQGGGAGGGMFLQNTICHWALWLVFTYRITFETILNSLLHPLTNLETTTIIAKIIHELFKPQPYIQFAMYIMCMQKLTYIQCKAVQRSIKG